MEVNFSYYQIYDNIRSFVLLIKHQLALFETFQLEKTAEEKLVMSSLLIFKGSDSGYLWTDICSISPFQ